MKKSKNISGFIYDGHRNFNNALSDFEYTQCIGTRYFRSREEAMQDTEGLIPVSKKYKSWFDYASKTRSKMADTAVVYNHEESYYFLTYSRRERETGTMYWFPREVAKSLCDLLEKTGVYIESLYEEDFDDIDLEV